MTNPAYQLAAISRYPVKSMMGEALNAIDVIESGLLGDRGYALIDSETNKIVSAKNPRKWPTLFSFHAHYASAPHTNQPLPAVMITLPDGRVISSTADDADAIISQALGRAVQLKNQAPQQAQLEQYWPEHEGQDNAISDETIAIDADAGSFFDYSPLHIITTATLSELQQRYPAGRMEARRFRPNLIIASDAQQNGFIENEWVGKMLSIGEVTLQITDPCPRCVMPTLAQGDLANDPKIMKTIAENTVHVPFAGKALPSIGVYAKVLQAGRIQRHDSVIIS
jgi:uncharacterized protein YcbX